MSKLSPVNVLLLLGALAQSITPCNAGDKGWILTQKTGLNGESKLYISAKGMRLVGDKAGYVIVMKAPLWNVQLFSEKTHAVYESDAPHFKGQLNFGLGLVSGARFTGLKTVATENESLEGLNCRRVSMDSGHPVPKDLLLMSKQRRRQLTRDGQMCRSLEYWTTQDLPVPKKAAAVVERIYQLPSQDGFPIRLKFINENGKNRTELDTTIQRADVASTLFSVPAGYHKVASEAEVIIDAKKQAVLDDLLQSIDDETTRK